jgi:hypothetical protein
MTPADNSDSVSSKMSRLCPLTGRKLGTGVYLNPTLFCPSQVFYPGSDSGFGMMLKDGNEREKPQEAQFTVLRALFLFRRRLFSTNTINSFLLHFPSNEGFILCIHT